MGSYLSPARLRRTPEIRSRLVTWCVNMSIECLVYVDSAFGVVFFVALMIRKRSTASSH